MRCSRDRKLNTNIFLAESAWCASNGMLIARSRLALGRGPNNIHLYVRRILKREKTKKIDCGMKEKKRSSRDDSCEQLGGMGSTK